MAKWRIDFKDKDKPAILGFEASNKRVVARMLKMFGYKDFIITLQSATKRELEKGVN